MSSVKRASAAALLSCLPRGFGHTVGRAAGLAAIVAVAGCSENVTRFDLLGDLFSPAPMPGSTGYAPTEYAPTGRGYRTGYSSGYGVEETSLPPARRSSRGDDRDDYRVVGRDYRPASARRAERPVRLAKAHEREPFAWADRTPRRWVEQPPLWTDSPPAPRRETEPFPWPDASDGRRSYEPAPAPRREAKPFPWPDPPVERRSYAPVQAPPSAFQGHYTMRRGDTLRRVARRYKVSVAQLKRVNGIADAREVRVGTVLAIPEPGAAPPAKPAAPRIVQAPPRRTAPRPQPRRTAARTPEARTPEPRTAPRERKTTGALPPPAVAGGKFRWPVRGRIISRFGTQPDGSKSEGINLAVPMGTDIHAAEAGRVHYVGDGLKGYGNLILIRHANGWVTAYAHADRTLVKVGEEVRRGQVIGKAGKTGPVAQPQLHFELRKGSVPVDPLPHLAG